jgi:hypothetical protein
MVVVYLKNGEKAPMPDADEVRLEAGGPAQAQMLRCFYGQREVGQFKWDEVAGYTISVISASDITSGRAYEAWGLNPNQ